MKINNIHQRQYEHPQTTLAAIFDSLASPNDRLWPWETWPPMRLSQGLEVGSHGGHGPIGYTVIEYLRGRSLVFNFTKPEAFRGTHRFEILALDGGRTLLRHTIGMNVSWPGLLLWVVAIRWLHDALLEDALAKVDRQLSLHPVASQHGFWVKFLRRVLRSGKKK